jgi:putative lipoprotein
MKKVIFAVICGLFLVGCAKNEPKSAEPQGASYGCVHHQKMMQGNMPSCPHHGMQGAMHEQMPAYCPAYAK